MVWVSVQFLWRIFRVSDGRRSGCLERKTVCRDLWSLCFSKPFLVHTSLPASSPKFWSFYLDSNIRTHLNYCLDLKQPCDAYEEMQLSVLHHISSGLSWILIVSVRSVYPDILALRTLWPYLSEHRFYQFYNNINEFSLKFFWQTLRQISWSVFHRTNLYFSNLP